MKALARWVRLLGLVALVCCLATDRAQAQEAKPDSIYQVRLIDGSTVVGRIESRTEERIVVITLAGVRLELLAAQVKDVTAVGGRVVNGTYWQLDPNPSRLFFAPTGRSVGKGSGYIGVFEIALPFLAYGITDRITIAGGAPILFGSLEFFYLAPKIEVIRASGTNVALGVLSFFAPQETEDLESIGIAYAVTTLGSRDHAFHGAVGFGYAGDDVAGQPAIMVGGETRLSRRIKLITENYFVAGETGALISGGIRVLGERMTGDVGMIGFFGGGESGCCFPIVNLSYSFGKQR